MPSPIEEALKSLNESIALLDEKKDLIGEETYLAMKNKLLSVCKNINRATKGVNDYKDDDDDDDNDNMSFTMPFTLVVTHKTSFDKVFNIAAALWRDKDNSKEIERRFINLNPSTNWSEASEKSRAYNAEQARRQGIDPTDSDVLKFNHYIRLATDYWGRFEKKWYRADATFNLVGVIDYDGVITYD
jgi:hypothetical protein